MEFVKGNLLEADAEALVNTVNTVGVMGKGIALQFREAFPNNYKSYRKAAGRGEVRVGKMFVHDNGQFNHPRYIINFPTKQHWRDPSKLDYIIEGLVDLQRVIRELDIKSIAIPPLGCGSGGLEWAVVRTLMVDALQSFEGVKIMVYEPAGAPDAERMRIRTEKPAMTLGRAALIRLLHRYAPPGYRFSLLEIQKLMYFLQAAGEPLRLNFAKKQYGPYAENLNHVLQRVEGHYLRGYGDRSRLASIHLLPNAIDEAEFVLKDNPETEIRINRVLDLAEGFETPYGLELLSTVHWLAQDASNRVKTPQEAIKGFEAWNRRKRDFFKPEHIHIAWDRLRSTGWM